MEVTEHLTALIFSILWACVTCYVAWLCGFFRLQESLPQVGAVPTRFIDVFTVFALFLGMEILFAPLAALIVYTVQTGHLITDDLKDYMSHQALGWFNLLAIISGGCGVAMGMNYLSSAQRQSIFGPTTGIWKNLCVGSMTWLISYPIIAVIGELVWFGLFAFGLETHLEQVAVKHLKSVSGFPFLLIATVGVIIFIVPVIEETLFRGVLQSWFTGKWGTVGGIIATSIIFACFHFSSSQGLANVELMLSLFVLSCFLGFVYARQRSLWAPIGLHLTFNAVSALIVIFE